MKKFVCLSLVVLLLLSGCSKPIEPKIIPHTIDLPPERPEDFAIYFEWGYSSDNFFDTYEGKIGKDLIINGSAESEMSVGTETLDRIYAGLRHYDIASINFELNSHNCAAPGESIGYMTPCGHYVVRFRVDGKEYEVRADDTAEGYECTTAFFSFVKLMKEEIYATPEYQAFPKAEGGYM